MSLSDIFIIIAIVLAIVLYLLYRKSSKNYKESLAAQEFVEANKMVGSIFVIDKKFDKPTPKDLPKSVYDQLDGASKRRKLYMVKAKVGPQIVTLLTEKNIYNVLVPKKTYKVELSGLYISGIVGMNLEDKKKKSLGEKASLFLKKDPKKEAERITKK